MTITSEIFHNYLFCKYRTYLEVKEKLIREKSEYEQLQIDLDKNYKINVLKKSFSHPETLNGASFNVDNLRQGLNTFTNVSISYKSFFSKIDALKKINGKSPLGLFHYIPYQFNRSNKITQNTKLLLVFKSYVLGMFQGKFPDYGEIIYGDEFKIKQIKVNDYLPHVKNVLEELNNLITSSEKPIFTISDHCRNCKSCKAQALETDDLSLLKTMNVKDIQKQNKKGIFTVTQLSYTFKPRKRKKRAKKYTRVHFPELKALAIREKKVFVYEPQELPSSTTRIYLDIEGNEENSFCYLIGLVIVNAESQKQYSFWANDKNEEESIVTQFLNICNQYDNFILFHYGSYEIKFLKRIKMKFPDKYNPILDHILKSSVNILSIIYANIYFPTYSNELKDIGNYLNFQWSAKNASGLQSIVWRTEWETNQDNSLKQTLLQYNIEDCLALKKTYEFIYLLFEKENSEKPVNQQEVVFANELKRESFYHWGDVDFFYPDFDFINKCAYFNYQREKVLVRTNKKLRKVIKKETNKIRYTPDKYIELKALRCPMCKSYDLEKYPQRTEKKVVFDLKFSKNGVRKQIILYSACEYSCLKRKHVFYPKKFSNIRMYAHNLKAWCVYQYVINKISQEEISRYIYDLFGFVVKYPRIHDMRRKLAKSYKGTYEQIIKRIVSSKVIHIDETNINLMKKSGYVWVLTNMEEVFFIYKESREGAFLKELLKDFKGVLVSDFYSAYDSLECEQQKCLIHLIRDLNGDLHENPFDEEFKSIAKEFSFLLKKIVETIDKYGLKKRHLHKHNKEVNNFFKKIAKNEFQSEKAIYYQKRFNKNKEKLFTFLNHDGVTWNNNNAENAIKYIAKWRRLVSGQIAQSSIEDYCIFISIYITCKYRGVNFLKFLLSKEKNIDKFRG